MVRITCVGFEDLDIELVCDVCGEPCGLHSCVLAWAPLEVGSHEGKWLCHRNCPAAFGSEAVTIMAGEHAMRNLVEGLITRARMAQGPRRWHA
jgi:hypothetical protein